MKKILQKNSWIVIAVWLIPFLSTIYLFQENNLRAIAVLISLLLWLVGYLVSKEKIGFSFLFIILISAFNITFRIGDIDLCYKNNIFVNYLCPTLHIVDIFLLLSLFVSLIELSFRDIYNKFRLLLPLILLMIFHFIFHNDLNTIVFSSRLFLVISLLIANYEYIREIKPSLSNFLTSSIILVLLFQLVLSILQFKLGRDLGLQFIGESNILSGSINSSFLSFSFGQFLRGYGTFPHPNVLAGYAVALSVFSFKFIDEKNKGKLIIYFLAFLITLVSLSRIHIFISLAFLSLYFIEKNKAMFYGFAPILFERFSSTTIGSISIQERWKLFITSLDMVKSRWLIGTGGGEFVRYLPNNIKTVSDISLYQPIHNSPLLLFFEYGILGFLVINYYLITIFFIRNKSANEKLICLIPFFMVGLFDHYLFSLPQGLIILMMILI